MGIGFSLSRIPDKEIIYRGDIADGRDDHGGFKVYKDGDILSPVASQKLINHSPDGFNWGYSGSGPAQLALALLLDVAGPDIAMKNYQRFKFDIVAGWGGTWSITNRAILGWLLKRGETHGDTRD